MSICEKLVYLADYIDMSRTFPDCVALREMFWGADPASMDADAREAHLRKVLLSSYDRTVLALLEEGALISHETMLARNELVEQIRRAEATH
jgi:HD superfamily phosphohydrolase YqeK